MNYSKNGLLFTKKSEGCKLSAYQDKKGIWTIGVGHTRGVFPGQIINDDEADALLRADISCAETAVNHLVKVNLNQDQFDALVDFTFNCGAGALAGSTLLRKLNAGDFDGAASEFEKWDKAGGVVLDGLLRRRKAEEALFNGESDA